MSWRARWSNPTTKPGPRLLTPLAPQCCNRTALSIGKNCARSYSTIPTRRKKLESIIHPQVRALAEQRIREHAAAGYAVIVYEVPLLFEGNLQEWLRPVILVACDVDTQRNRLQSRDNLSAAQAQKHIDAQMSLEEKRRLADYVIENNGSLEDLKRQVQAVLEKIKTT